MTKKLKKICDECGSTDVRIDAWASWNEDTQEWELAETYENPFCMDCEGPCRIDDEDMPEGEES